MHNVPSKPPTEILVWGRSVDEAVDELAALGVRANRDDLELVERPSVDGALPFRYVVEGGRAHLD
jgi:hypothetical protein